MGSAVDHEAEVTAAIAVGAGRRGALLPVLHAIQDRLGHVPPEAVPRIAQALNLSRAEVHGVLTFYSDFRSTPPAPHVLRLCLAEACMAQGAAVLQAQAAQRLGASTGAGAKADATQGAVNATVGLEPVYCLGNCACAPALMLDGRLHGRVTPARLDALLQELGVAP